MFDDTLHKLPKTNILPSADAYLTFKKKSLSDKTCLPPFHFRLPLKIPKTLFQSSLLYPRNQKRNSLYLIDSPPHYSNGAVNGTSRLLLPPPNQHPPQPDRLHGRLSRPTPRGTRVLPETRLRLPLGVTLPTTAASFLLLLLLRLSAV